MTRLVITRGLPGSGKTSFARAWSKEPGRAKAPSRDELRASLYGIEGFCTRDQEQTITAVQESAVRSLIGSGLSGVIVDDTNLRARVARRWAAFASELGADFEVIDFRVSVEQCQANDQARAAEGGRHVGAEVISRLAEKFPPNRWPDIKPVAPLDTEPYTPDTSKPPAWIFDVDGTLAHMQGRSPYDWHRVAEDAVDITVRDVLWALEDRASVIIVSGRDSACRRDTIDWLNDQGIPTEYVYMRPEGDNRKDAVIKLEIFNQKIRDRFNVWGVFDDRGQVVSMWRTLGLKCFQVAEGDF